MCGIIATKTDAELRDLFSRLDEFDVGFFSNSRAVELVQHLINKGSLQVGAAGGREGDGRGVGGRDGGMAVGGQACESGVGERGAVRRSFAPLSQG